MSIFEYDSYKRFVLERVKSMPSGGRGEFRKLADALQMHTTSVSQVFRQDKDLTSEQAARLCAYWGLTEIETDYFLNLVEFERAGNNELRKIIRSRIKKIQEQSKSLSVRVRVDHVLSEEQKSRYYSNWYFCAVHLLCDIPQYATPERIAQILNLPIQRINEVLELLKTWGVVIEEKDRLKMGKARTFLENTSPLVSRHHTNWRNKAIEKLDAIDNTRDFVLTAPMTLSNADAIRFRKKLVEFTQGLLKENESSPSEELHVLNVDWFKL